MRRAEAQPQLALRQSWMRGPPRLLARWLNNFIAYSMPMFIYAAYAGLHNRRGFALFCAQPNCVISITYD